MTEGWWWWGGVLWLRQSFMRANSKRFTAESHKVPKAPGTKLTNVNDGIKPQFNDAEDTFYYSTFTQHQPPQPHHQQPLKAETNQIRIFVWWSYIIQQVSGKHKGGEKEEVIQVPSQRRAYRHSHQAHATHHGPSPTKKLNRKQAEFF